MKLTTHLTRGAIIAAVYAALTILLAPISYGPVQVRVSEALTVLPFFEPAAIPGLFLGCIIANIYGGNGLWDIIGGSLLTLAAAYLTWKIRKPALALLPPVILNGFGVAYILMVVLRVPYWLTVGYVSLGESVAVYLLGYPFLIYILKRGIFVREDILQKKLGRG